MVVWLDELQRYLDGEQGLTGGVVRALLGAPHPAVIISTIWPDRYAAYATVPAPGGPDPCAREREVLDLAAVIRIGPEFSPAERGRARGAAGRDRRLKIALESKDYGPTQTLAAAPQLVARWQDARTASPYAWAVLTAALDTARLGARGPLSADFLRAAASGYCTSQQQAEAPDNWFEQALAYATGKLHGAAAALAPAGAGMGRLDGYIAADYLIQYAGPERRYTRTRKYLGRHPRPHSRPRRHHPARGKRLEPTAVPLRHLAVPSRRRRRRRVRRLVAGQTAGLLRRSGRGHTGIASSGRRRRLVRRQVAGRAAGRSRGRRRIARPCRRRQRVRRGAAGRAAGPAQRPGRAPRPGRRRRQVRRQLLVGLLADRDDLDGLRVLADAGHGWAGPLADLLIKQGRGEEAERLRRFGLNPDGSIACS
jgi:hypothetical protein